MEKPVVFLSGPITGVSNYREIFGGAAERLQKDGYVVLNPAMLPDGLASARDYMDICFAMLDKASVVVQLDGWECSQGANQEYGYARALGKQIVPYRYMVGVEQEP